MENTKQELCKKKYLNKRMYEYNELKKGECGKR